MPRLSARSLLAVGLLIPFLAGCIPEIHSSLSDPASSPIDRRLVGGWMHASHDEITIISIAAAPAAKSGALSVKYVVLKDDDKPPRVMRMRAWTWRSGARRFLTVEAAGARLKGVPQRFVAAYRFDEKDRLRIGLMDRQLTEAAIKAGNLEGRIAGDGWARGIVVTASRDALRKFVAGSGDALFRNQAAPLGRIAVSEE